MMERQLYPGIFSEGDKPVSRPNRDKKVAQESDFKNRLDRMESNIETIFQKISNLESHIVESMKVLTSKVERSGPAIKNLQDQINQQKSDFSEKVAHVASRVNDIRSISIKLEESMAMSQSMTKGYDNRILYLQKSIAELESKLAKTWDIVAELRPLLGRDLR